MRAFPALHCLMHKSDLAERHTHFVEALRKHRVPAANDESSSDEEEGRAAIGVKAKLTGKRPCAVDFHPPHHPTFCRQPSSNQRGHGCEFRNWLRGLEHSIENFRVETRWTASRLHTFSHNAFKFVSERLAIIQTFIERQPRILGRRTS